MLPVQPPIRPMLVSPVRELPREADMLFEPKWDGFRCLVFAEPGGRELVFLQFRTSKGFNRYFPEVVRTVELAVDRPVVLDGELIVARNNGHGDRLDWDALSERIHPLESRICLLAKQAPAVLVAFDLLALDDRDLRPTPLATRRELLTGLDLDTLGLHTTAVTEDPATAADWFRLFEGAGLDGVIGKRAEGHFEPGKRTRTAECVVAGCAGTPTSTPAARSTR